MFFPIGLSINDNDFVYAGAGDGYSGTSVHAPYNESYMINSKVAVRNSLGNITVNRAGTVKVLYSASGFSNTDTTAYQGKSRIDKGTLGDDGTVTWTTVGAEQSSARLAKAAVTFEVNKGDSIRIMTRNSASQRGGYSWAIAFVPNEPAAASEE